MRLAKQINTRLAQINLSFFIGKSIHRVRLRKVLNNVFKPMKVRFQIKIDDDTPVTVKNIPVSGFFHDNTPNCTVVLHFRSEQMAYKFTRTRLNRFVFRVAQILQHELIHRDQRFRRKNNGYLRPLPVSYSKTLSKKRKENILYYSQTDEIESYAHDLAMEMCYFYPNESPTTIFNNINKHQHLFVFRCYKSVYRRLQWGCIRKMLLKKTWKWLPTIRLPEMVGG